MKVFALDLRWLLQISHARRKGNLIPVSSLYSEPRVHPDVVLSHHGHEGLTSPVNQRKCFSHQCQSADGRRGLRSTPGGFECFLPSCQSKQGDCTVSRTSRVCAYVCVHACVCQEACGLLWLRGIVCLPCAPPPHRGRESEHFGPRSQTLGLLRFTSSASSLKNRPILSHNCF